jgi:hypothetical protein
VFNSIENICVWTPTNNGMYSIEIRNCTVEIKPVKFANYAAESVLPLCSQCTVSTLGFWFCNSELSARVCVCVGGGCWIVTSLFSKWALSFCHVHLQVLVSKLRDLCQWNCMSSLFKISLRHFAFDIISHVLSLRVVLSFEEPCTYAKTHTSNYSVSDLM